MKFLGFLAVFPLLLIAQPDPAMESYQAWEQQHRTGDDAARGRALFDASTEWVAKWPDSRFAWQQRRESLVGMRSCSPELWKEVGENLIRLSTARTAAFEAASDWVACGIHLKEAKALISAEIAWLDSQPQPATPRNGTLADRIDAVSFRSRLFYPLVTLARAGIPLKEFDSARAAIQRIHSWLEGDFKHDYDQDPLATFPDYWSTYFTLSAQLAEAEGRKADALAFYHRVVTDPYYRRYTKIYLKETSALWSQIGGTPEGWTQFSEVPPLPPGVPARYFGTPFIPWLALDFKLPPLEAAHFDGKTTLVYLWTSSCAPCWAALPGVQKVHEAVKNRNDLQVLTLDVDDDPATLAAFMQQKGYDFPAIIAPAYIKKLLPELLIGQLWIVDAAGAVRLQRSDNRIAIREQAFVDELIYKMSQQSRVARGTPVP